MQNQRVPRAILTLIVIVLLEKKESRYTYVRPSI
jgi:hypothetical protein